MTEPIKVCSADTHLAPRAWAKYPGLAGDAYYGLRQLVDYCTAHDLDLILAGDVFDKLRPDPLTVYHMRTQLDRMERQNLAVDVTQGQHELDRVSPWINAVSWWPQHQHEKTFETSGVTFYGLDWTPADRVRAAFDAVPESTNVLVAHQVWRDLMGPRIGESECAFADVPHVQLVLTGDFHRHLVLGAENRQGRAMTALSPGPVCMQSIDEDPKKQFFVLNDDLSVVSVPLKARRCLRFEIKCKENLDVFLTDHVEPAVAPQDGVPPNIAKNILHVRYNEDVPEAYARITAAVGTRAHLFITAVKQKRDAQPIETVRRRALADGGMAACLELVHAKGSPQYRDALSLLTAAAPLDQLAAIRAAFFHHRGEDDNDQRPV